MKRRRSDVDKREAAQYLLTFKGEPSPSTRRHVPIEEPVEEQPSRLVIEEGKENSGSEGKKESVRKQPGNDTHAKPVPSSCREVLDALAENSMEQLLKLCENREVQIDPNTKDPVIIASRLLLEGGYGDEGKRSVCLLLRKHVNRVDALLKLLGLNGVITVEDLLNKRFSNYRHVHKKQKHDSSSPRSNPQETSPSLQTRQKTEMTTPRNVPPPDLLYNPYHTLIESVRATARVQQGALLAMQNQSLMAAEQLRAHSGTSNMNAGS